MRRLFDERKMKQCCIYQCYTINIQVFVLLFDIGRKIMANLKTEYLRYFLGLEITVSFCRICGKDRYQIKSNTSNT